MTQQSRKTLLALVLVCCLGVGLLAGTGPASAGDGVTIISFDAEDAESTANGIALDADAGETVELEVIVSDHGDYNGNGIDNLSLTIAHESDVLSVTDVEHGPMLADGNSDATVDGTADIDDENGTVIIEQERTPSGDGATATDTAATLTLAVDDDAEPATETLEIVESEAIVITGYPQSIVDRNAQVHIEGGADDSEPADESGDETGTDDPDGITLADDAEQDTQNDTADENDTTDSSTPSDDAADDAAAADDEGDDAVPGVAIPGAIVAIALWVGLQRRH
ncbi:cohesin domain-containing protein [Natronolimnobius baerhuensis]|uniref:Uncharacterized protein n=1 Tax=Natronolimnobius baerhuensis TaxID=253108 RepID=A0A202EDL5_9EURY|nr:cohesin domain-containing protein [Natronolimnobius baerhuensis]OVE86297.1 hypothetical protein B2G88_05825 [Natronolimnobius baerhuensis]